MSRKNLFRRLLACVAAFCLFVQAGLACAWDRDTIGDEAERFPAVADAIMGRLKVMPKSFYEARIKILEKKNSEFTLGELDDLTVAYDKLGDFENALRFSKQKRQLLDRTSNPEDEYRYWANLGTIEAHEALRKRDSVNVELLSSGIEHLEKAVEINKEAHFGREVVQIEVLKLIRAHQKIGELQLSPELGTNWDSFLKRESPEKVQKGIIGMMAFGSGPDNFELLSLLASTIRRQEGQFHAMIQKRLGELVGSRRPFFEVRRYPGNGVEFKEQFQADYAVLKKDASNYRELVEAYVDTKLNQGKHPDTDPTFWNDWKEIPRPDLKKIAVLHPKNQALVLIGGFLLFIVVLPWVAMFLISKKLKQKQIEP